MAEVSNAFFLETARLRLRPWHLADRAGFAALNADAEVMEHMPRALSRAESDALADRIEEHIAEHGFGLWALERRDEGRFLGFVGLSRVPEDLPAAPAVEVGWRLARAAWGHGYASEAARAACQDGFVRVGLGEIVSFTALDNVRSSRVMERIGMTRDPSADFEHPRVPVGHRLRPHLLYRLRASELRDPEQLGPGQRDPSQSPA